MTMIKIFFAALVVVLAPAAAEAAPALDGAPMGWPWALPFAGILLASPPARCCSRRSGTTTTARSPTVWALLTLEHIGLCLRRLARARRLRACDAGRIYELHHPAVLALHRGRRHLHHRQCRRQALEQCAVLAFGTAIASIVGTTGAAMVLVRPLIRANANAHAQRPRYRVFHFPGGQYRRRAVAARRPAAVRRLPARRRFLLAGGASLARDLAGRRAGADRSSSPSTSGIRAATDRPPSKAARSGSTASSTCR